jgi:hypothetical protein
MVTASIPYGYSLYYGLLGGGHVAEQLEARRQIDEELGAGDACVHRLAGWMQDGCRMGASDAGRIRTVAGGCIGLQPRRQVGREAWRA